MTCDRTLCFEDTGRKGNSTNNYLLPKLHPAEMNNNQPNFVVVKFLSYSAPYRTNQVNINLTIPLSSYKHSPIIVAE